MHPEPKVGSVFTTELLTIPAKYIKNEHELIPRSLTCENQIYFNYNPGLAALAQPGRGHWTRLDYKDGNIFYKGYYKTHSIEVHARAHVYYIYVCLPQTYYKNAAPLMTPYAKKKLLKVINDAFHGIFFPQPEAK